MQIGNFWVHTTYTLTGPWHVTGRNNIWYIINILTGTTKRIGRTKGRGLNFHDRAVDVARERNEVFLRGHKQELPQYMGRYPEFDKTIAEVLHGNDTQSQEVLSH